MAIPYTTTQYTKKTISAKSSTETDAELCFTFSSSFITLILFISGTKIRFSCTRHVPCMSNVSLLIHK